MRQNLGFYFFAFLAISFAAAFIWLSKRTPSPTVSIDPIGNYESIPIRSDSFVSQLKLHLQGLSALSRVSFPTDNDTRLDVSFREGNLFRHFDIKDSSEFYKRWTSIRYDSATSTLKMRFDVKKGMIDVPAQLAFSIFKKASTSL